MWLLLEQDKAVDAQRRQEHLQQAADRAASAMQAALAELNRNAEPPAGVLHVRIGPTLLDVQPPRGLLFFPDPHPTPDPAAFIFADAERAEFVRQDLNAAAAIYTRLAADQNKSVRAGAPVCPSYRN